MVTLSNRIGITMIRLFLGFSCLLSSFPFYLQASDAAIQEEKVEAIEPVVILGGGVGALTSALYLSRAGLEPLILEGASPGGLITQSHSVQNWPGELEISGFDLIDKMRAQVVANGAEFRSEEVVAVDFSKRPFTITTRPIGRPDELHTIRTESCIIAMGTETNYLGVPGETGPNGYWGKGVSNCAVCDGSFYRDRIVGIVGGGDAAVLEGLYLSQIAKQVYVFVRKDAFRAVETKRLEALLARPNVHILYETTVVSIQGDGTKVTQVQLLTKDQEKPSDFPLDGLFLAIGSRPNSLLFQNILKLDREGYIQLQKDQETSIGGIYAIGDIVDPVYKQAISAAGDGAKAAIQVQKYLSDRSHHLIVKRKKSSETTESLAQNESIAKPEMTVSVKPVYLAASQKGLGAIEISSKEEFDQELKNAETPVLIDFYARWCKPCKQVTPIFEQTASEYSGKIKFLKVNVDKFYPLSQSYEINAMPTVIVLDAKGSIIDRRVGPDAILDLLQHLDTIE